MKRQLSNSGVAMVLSLLFMLGGLFIANDVQAQTQTVMQQQPVINWISPLQAQAIALAEIENLTVKVIQMKDNGQEKLAINKVKAELRFYKMLEKALLNGSTTQAAFEFAWGEAGLGADAVKSPFTVQESAALRLKLIDKLSD